VTQPPPAAYDAGNPLLAPGPARLDLASADQPGGGKIALVTVRTASATQTVMLSAEDLRVWAGLLTGLADEMTGGLVVATPLDVAALDQLASQFPPGLGPPPARRRRP
jgi:hypothetical protein